ncbi:pyridoxal-phosphate dependent enzyme [Mesorhizobium sp. CO1-1-8]|uniref:pyridoxal-phosphate dependent enzyme n=1 Tax=Mesorhizobium sp. CO1-1-8 TaxID=2876631 RepID=UPI001CD15441|nr:pyridoxal-phosphate dependent enzyme [Mesorhizobium sp. CO1-1-8]MBZ9772277.1 pyridoxal-phosphate dependent enzyme [Mesorhizobium sp. CO1-1-8]
MPRPDKDLNPRAIGLRCLRCKAKLAIADYHQGCPSCHAEGMPASVAVEYRELPRTLERIADWQVYPAHPTLGEGDTPLVAMEPLADEIGIRRLVVKNEGANPTGSHKDRMSRFVVQRALAANATIVVAASSGNAGVSLAAYAARVGLGCVIVTTPDMNPNWRRAIEMHGATLLAAQTPLQRWQVVASRVQSREWYPATNFSLPAVGSNPFGVDGYRSVALEMLRDLGTDCTDVLVPTSRGDLLWGIARGYKDLQRAGFLEKLPRVHAVEPFARLSKVLCGEDYRGTFPGDTALTSIGGSTVAYQALEALASCGGTAVVADEAGARADQCRLANCGLYLELSSAAALTGLRKLVSIGVVPRDACAVLIGTSTGLSEHQSYTQPIPLAT